MFDSVTFDAVNKRQKTVPVRARITESDVAALDEAAETFTPLPVTRSHLIALIVREWITARSGESKRKLSPKRK